MRLFWLKLAKPCTLELPPDVKDYTGQRLVFRPRDGVRKGVREDVYNHPLVQRYLASRYIELDASMAQPAAKPAAVVAPPPPPPPPPVAAAEVAVESPEPVLPISEVVMADEVVETEELSEMAELLDAAETPEETESPRKRRKSRRH